MPDSQQSHNVIPQSLACAIQDVIATDVLAHRLARAPDYASENAALLELARCLAESPMEVVKKLVDAALRLTGAHSAGMSIAEGDGPDAIFRWRATAGEFDRYLGGTMPRHFSPCGTVLERGTALLMKDPVRAYPYIAQLHRPVCEVLLVPFSRGDKLVGTVWTVSHSVRKVFDREDLRLVESLAQFASLATRALEERDRLEQENRRKTEFLATLAHELRNPLAPIRNAVEVLKRAPDRVPLVLSMMERQVSHLVRLIDDLLDISRITTNKLTLRTERVRVAALVDEAVEATQPHCAAKKHDVSIAVPEDLQIDADPVRIAQVLTNLLTNAAKYTPSGGRIFVSAASRGDHVCIEITDDGAGIAPEHIDHIFELFGQVNDHDGGGGLGIGLALSRRLIEMHGGTLVVRSAGPSMGSTFEIILPRG